MRATPSPSDLAFQSDFEAGKIGTADFSHRNHLRLIFVYLCQGSVGSAHEKMRETLRWFLAANGVPADKYHETMTVAWTQAVHHFMQTSPDVTSFDDLIAADDRLLNTDIMLTHYSKEHLFSDAARTTFVTPDLDAIPQY